MLEPNSNNNMKTAIKDYFNNLSDIIDAESRIASSNKHNPDIGDNREHILINFYNKHLPDRQRAIQGGKILALGGIHSKQMDVIVKNDLFPKFEQNHKTFVLLESVAAAVTVKSFLDTSALEDCLSNIASIPQLDTKTFSLQNSSIRRPELEQEFMKSHPTLVVFAYDGISSTSLDDSMINFYTRNPTIPMNRRPHYIIVNGKYFFHRLTAESKSIDGVLLKADTWTKVELTKELQGIPLSRLIHDVNSYNTFLSCMSLHFHEYLNETYFSQ
ncbi:MAG: hypothetical protein K0S44_1091 [Bacteroidetes bacterium]|jgi:hypothetical protein|nr:hypothetical protein [Bacteroidota bacterium]